MKQAFQIAAIFVFGIFSACASSSGSGASGDGKKNTTKTVSAETKKVRSEDLSFYRTKYPDVPPVNLSAPPAPVPPVNHVNEKANALLDTLAALNKSVKYAQGYRILAYTGSDRQEALELRRIIINTMPEERDYMTFSRPTYKLKIGDYFTRMEANTVLQRIKSLNPNASIIREQINVNR